MLIVPRLRRSRRQSIIRMSFALALVAETSELRVRTSIALEHFPFFAELISVIRHENEIVFCRGPTVEFGDELTHISVHP